MLPFSSTYLCGSAFCTLVIIKSKSRNKLSNVEADLRCALTNTKKPRIKQLVASNRHKNHIKSINFVKSFHSKHNLFANSYAMMFGATV